MSASPPEPEANVPAKRPRRGRLAAVRWALAGAVCAGGFWALALLVFFSWAELATAHHDIKGHTLGAALLLGTLSVITGLVMGVYVGLFRGGDERGTAAIALGMIGVLTGVIGGGLSAPAVVALGEWLHPVVASSLAWALAGVIAALIGYEWSRWTHPPTEPTDEDESEARAAPPRMDSPSEAAKVARLAAVPRAAGSGGDGVHAGGRGRPRAVGRGARARRGGRVGSGRGARDAGSGVPPAPPRSAAP